MRLTRTTQHVYFVGGLGAGKTHVGAWAFLLNILRNRRDLQRQGRRGELRYLAGAPSYQDIKEGTWPALMDLLGEFEAQNGCSLVKRAAKTNPRELELITGDVIIFPALNPGTLKAVNAAGVWHDEAEEGEDPAGARKLLLKRLRNPRSPWLFSITTSTPGIEGQGVLPEFDQEIASGCPKHAIVHAETFTNPAHEGTDYYDDLKKRMSVEEVEARLHGRPQPPSSTIYGRDFDTDESVAWQWVRPNKAELNRRVADGDCEYWLTFDWGGHYSGLLIEHWPGQGPHGIDVVIDEHHKNGGQDFQFLDEVVAMCNGWGLDRADVRGVTADRQPRDAFNLCWTKRYWPGRVNGKTMDARRKKRGIKTVKWRLSPSIGPRSLLIAPHLLQSRYKRGLVPSLKNYQWKEKRDGGQIITLDRVRQEHWASHACDALRYYEDFRFSRFRREAIGQPSA